LAEESLLDAFQRVNRALTAPGAPFELLDAHDPPCRRYAGTVANVLAIAERARTRFGPQPFIELDGKVLTFEAAFAGADRLAVWLAREHGIGHGDRVGIAMRNLPEWFIAFFAVARLGAIATLLNSRGAPEEICLTARQVGCSLVFADDARARAVRSQLECPVIDIDEIGRIASDAQIAAIAADHPQPQADDPLLIIFTSGTTGRPKGATLTHLNICAVARDLEMRAEVGLIQAAEQMGMEIEALRALMPPPAPVLLISPMFHISGIVGMLLSLHVGCSNILMRRWDAVEALEMIDARGGASLSGPSLVFSDLLALPDAPRRMRTLRSCAVAGQATPSRLAQELRESEAQIGVTSCWGQTECTGAATTGSAALFAAHPGTVGPAVPYVEIRVADAEGNTVPVGEVGELQVRGPTIMRGYWGDEKATADTLRDGWLCTGDLGRIDELGLVYVDDRAKDMVIAGGQNIYCAEVERVLSMLHEQHEVALFGVPDERLGERAIAAITLKAGLEGSLDEAAVKSHVRAHLASYKVPLEVRFDLGPFPRNDLGKINKAQLAQRYLQTAPVSAA
jgi:acyl-CoA synthetase (AMP-forming)/AMP-acid ligase II